MFTFALILSSLLAVETINIVDFKSNRLNNLLTYYANANKTPRNASGSASDKGSIQLTLSHCVFEYICSGCIEIEINFVVVAFELTTSEAQSLTRSKIFIVCIQYHIERLKNFSIEDNAKSTFVASQLRRFHQSFSVYMSFTFSVST